VSPKIASRFSPGCERLERRQPLAANVVLEWNETALATIRVERTPPPPASRALAITHIAMYDAITAIDRRFTPYQVALVASPLTSREAAVASAAHRALTALFPAHQAAFDRQLTSSLAAVPDGVAETLGVALGVRAANAILAARADDGWNDTVVHQPTPLPGHWQPTPPANAPSLLPHWGNVRPFAMSNLARFTPRAVPALTSAKYAAEFREVKSLGAADSTTRTADQTASARFWSNGAGTATPPGHLNTLAALTATARRLTVSESARLFAMFNVALADAAIMAWNAKYATDSWRPVTAIRAADTDGNPRTIADPTWTPLLATPPFPSYVSGHASFSGAAAAVLKSYFRSDSFRFTLPSEDPAIAARSFTSFSQAARESADSRLYGGIHWRSDNADGLAAGRRIGNHVFATLLRPLDRRPPAGHLFGRLAASPEGLRFPAAPLTTSPLPAG